MKKNLLFLLLTDTIIGGSTTLSILPKNNLQIHSNNSINCLHSVCASKTIIVQNFTTERHNLNDYGMIYVGDLSIDLTGYLGIKTTGQLARFYSSIYFPNLLATANKFSRQEVQRTYNYYTNNIPYDNPNWRSAKKH